MYRKAVIVIVVLVLANLLMAGCVQRTDKYNKKPTGKTKISPVQAELSSLRDSLSIFQQKVRETATYADQMSVRCDSLAAENKSLAVENGKFRFQLTQIREKTIPDMRRQYEDEFDGFQKLIKRKNDSLFEMNGRIWDLERRNSLLVADKEALEIRLSRLILWARKWKHDSHRNFIKVLFGAGKAPVPDVPAPQLEPDKESL